MCWKKDKTQTFLRTPNGNIKGIQGHMASKHAEFVDKYVKQRQKVETMKKLYRQRQRDLRQQWESEQSRMRLERKERKEQEIQSIKMEKADKKHKNKELGLILKNKTEKLRIAT